MAHFQSSIDSESEDNIYETIIPVQKEENIYSEIEHPKVPFDATEKSSNETQPEYMEVGSKLSPAMDSQTDHFESADQMPHYIVMKGTTTLQASSQITSVHHHSSRQKNPPPPTYPKTKRSNSVSYSSSEQSPALSRHQCQRAFSSSVNLTENCGIQLSEFVAASCQSLPQRVEVVKEKSSNKTQPEYMEVGSKLSPAMDSQTDHFESADQMPHYIVMKGTTTIQASSRITSVHHHSTRHKNPPPPTYPKTKRSNSVSYTSSEQSPALSRHQYQRAFSSSVNLTENCGIQLSEFVATSCQSLPKRVEVVKGMHGLDGKPTPLICDMLNIHQVIERDVVKVEDTLLSSTQSFLFPVNSVVKFSPVYHSNDHCINGLDNMCFSIAELLSLKPLPKVVCVLMGCNSKSLSLKFETNEILVVKGIVKPSPPQSPSTIKVYSIRAKHEKSLVESNTTVRLSITPECLRMNLNEITEHLLSQPLPVMLFSDSVSASKIPKHLFSRILYLKEVITEVLLLATYAHAQPRLKDKLLCIPIDLDISVCIISLGKDEIRDLKSETARIVASKHTSVQSLNASMQASQEEIYAAVRPQRFRPHMLELSKQDDSSIYDDATSIRSSVIQNHMDSSQNAVLKGQRKEIDTVSKEDSGSGQRFRDNLAAVEPLSFLEEQLQKEISWRANRSLTNSESDVSSGGSTSVDQESAITQKAVLDGTTTTVSKKPLLPPKPQGIIPSTCQPRKKTLTVIQEPPSSPRAEGDIETKSLESSHVSKLLLRNEQNSQRTSFRVRAIVDGPEVETKQGNKPPPVPPKPAHIQPKPKVNEHVQTGQTVLSETDQLSDVSPKTIQEPVSYSTKFGKASIQLSQTLSSEFSPSSPKPKPCEQIQTALSKTDQLSEVSSPKAIQKVMNKSTKFDEAPSSAQPSQPPPSEFTPSSPTPKAYEKMQTDQTFYEASAPIQMSSQFPPSLVSHSSQGKFNQDFYGGLHTTSTRAEPSSLDSAIMTFPEFIAQYAESFPIRVRVQEGLYEIRQGFSHVNSYPLSTNDVYNIHFLKETKVVTFSDLDGHMYTAPLNSSVQFCPLYDPEGNFSKAVQGYKFNTVKDILTAAELPKVICATRPYTVPNPKSSVTSHEVLAIREASKTTFRRKSVLKVHSITTNEDKVLYEDCQGHFSTAPQLVRLHLPEIILCVPNPFPLRSIMTMDSVESEYSEPLAAYLTSNTVTLFHTSVELSVIATTHWKSGKAPSKADQIPFEIPTTLNFLLSIEYPSSSRDFKTLTSTTKQIYNHFDPTQVRLFSASNAIPQKTSMTREVLYQAIRIGHENEGIALKKPSFGNPIYYRREECSNQRLPSLNSSENESNSDNEVSDDTSYNETPRMPAFESFEDHHYSTSKYQGRLIKGIQQQTCDSDKIKKSRESQDQKFIDIGKLAIERKQTDQTSMEVSTASPLLSPGPPLELMHTALASLTQEEQNIAFLQTLNKQQILNLLDAMKLSQYKAIFDQEQVDGVILANCNEIILESELNITKKLHRVRIMQVITGTHSAESILEEATSYVKFSHSLYT